MARRLAAILIADVVDYSRLMGSDEERTLAALSELRHSLFDPPVMDAGGKIIKRMGDGWIVEFPTISDATAAAITIQSGLEGHDLIQLRIGIHIGDITFREEDIYGDGINIAARLEALAAPGQILISDTAQQSLDGKAAAQFAGGTPVELKNIARPVSVWHWPADMPLTAADAKTLPLPDKPSIAVLPLANISGDPDQEYFSDGISEDIITLLSKYGWFFVIARNSSFAYKGQTVDVRQVGRELGVRYVLEGSVRKAGSRVRVSAQLVEAETGSHVWADRFDRELEDIFELQDDITLAIAGAIEPELAAREQRRVAEKPTSHMAAWELALKGNGFISRNGLEDLNKAIDLFTQAITLDPYYAHAHGCLAYTYTRLLHQGYVEDWEVGLAAAKDHAQKALAIDASDYFGRLALGAELHLRGEINAALVEFRLADEIIPGHLRTAIVLAAVYLSLGDYDAAIEVVDVAVRRSPHDPILWAVQAYQGAAYRRKGELRKAIGLFEKAALVSAAGPNVFLGLAACYWETGDQDKAVAAVKRARALQPSLTIAYLRNIYARDRRHLSLGDSYFESLQKAGLPEK